jgi:glycosyltransferase involved in cell wall biosynthesis
VKRILVITNNLQQASYRLRIAALIAPLAERGFRLDVKVRPRALLERRRLLRSAGGYDAVILQRKLLDGFDARLLRGMARRVYFDVDDAVMYCQEPAGPIARWRAWRRFVATAGNVHHVVAGNEHLAELFRKHVGNGAAVSVLPTVVDVNRYAVKTHGTGTGATLVWIGSRSTLPYVREFMPALEAAAKLVAGLKLIIVADETISSAVLPVEFVPWSAAGESAALCRGDIGIAPTPENSWTRGKCGFKIVQYMAAGLPVVASPVGANQELVSNETGLLPAKLDDWPAAIAALANDAEMRSRFGAAARCRAEKEYSLQRAADFWAALLHES